MTSAADDLTEPAVRFTEAAAAAVPHPEIEPELMSSSERFFNREVSWLNFNERVLEEAENPRHPLLERLRFLSISGNNLDEFYMVRVAGLKGQVREGVRVVSQDGLTPTEQLEQVNAGAAQLVGAQQRQWRKLRAELATAGLKVIDPSEATKADLAWLEEIFLSQLFPILTPLAIDPAHPFLFIPNLAFCMALKLKRLGDGKSFYALTPVPTQVARFWELPQEARRGSATPRRRNTKRSTMPPNSATPRPAPKDAIQKLQPQPISVTPKYAPSMNIEPCVRLGMRISPKISENPAASRNSRPPRVTLLMERMVHMGVSGNLSRFAGLSREADRREGA